MTNELNEILNLIRCLILNKEDTNKEIEQVNWSDMFSTACRNNIAPFLFDAVTKLNENTPIEESILQQWKNFLLLTKDGITEQVVITKNIRLLALRESAGEWSKTIVKQE